MLAGFIRRRLPVLLLSTGALASHTASATPSCDKDNGGLRLPPGFCALVVADKLGQSRHLAVRNNGDIYVMLEEANPQGAIIALHDKDGDGRMDERRYFGSHAGTGIMLHQGYLYAAPNDRIERYRLPDDALVPPQAPDVLVKDLPNQHEGHTAKAIAFDDQDNLYLTLGAPTNACQKTDRAPAMPGTDPCPELDYAAGVWRFSANKLEQTPKDGKRLVTGTRHIVGMARNPQNGELYGMQNGRDQLHELWPKLFTQKQSDELPAEELLHLKANDDYGWPYCYYDQFQQKRVLAPEYGGDGHKLGRCEGKQKPVATFPAHYAPLDLLFYQGQQFPARYRNGAFIAFHGSWNRSLNAGYQVDFLAFAKDGPKGQPEVFATGFADGDKNAPAAHRPVGLAQGPDGSLYVSDDHGGRIWRILFKDQQLPPH
jgi:glucose/arabinose dehydrogenase